LTWSPVTEFLQSYSDKKLEGDWTGWKEPYLPLIPGMKLPGEGNPSAGVHLPKLEKRVSNERCLNPPMQLKLTEGDLLDEWVDVIVNAWNRNVIPFRGIIHMAGINMLWRSSETSVRQSVQNAMQIVVRHGFCSVAFPLIGAGSGGGSPDQIQTFMTDELSRIQFSGEGRIVRYTHPSPRCTPPPRDP